MAGPLPYRAIDAFNPIDGFNSAREIDNGEVQAWGMMVESIISYGSVWRGTKAALDLVTPAAGTYPGGVVTNDSTANNNGFYIWDGSSWARSRGFPDTAAVLTNIAGTANAITADTDAGVSPADIQILILPDPPGTNTSTTVTLALNGASAKSIKAASGSNLAIGDIVDGVGTLFFRSGSEWRQLFPSNVAERAEAALAAAEDAQTAAIAYADSAEVWAQLSEKWAESPEDVAVTPGKYSAFHWSQKAAESSGYDPTNVTISGGVINGTAVGVDTPAAGSFTALSVSGIATLAGVEIGGGTIDSSEIGATEPAAASFTTLSLGNGGSTEPSICAASDPDTGVFFEPGVVALATAGVERLRISDAGLDVDGPVNATEITIGGSPLVVGADRYVSAEQAITSGGLLTLPHGKDVAPLVIQARLVNRHSSAIHGWGVGEGPIVALGADDGLRVQSCWADETNIYLRFSSQGQAFAIGNKTTGDRAGGITNSQWRLIVEAVF